MLKLVVIGTIAVVAQAFHPIRDEIVHAIRQRTGMWQAHDVETNPLSNKSYQELLGLCGTFMVPANEIFPGSDVTDTPTDFDASKQWPDFVHPIRDQQSCGSCWAFGATEAFSDRFAIASSGKINVVLSPEDMVSCDRNDFGCGGGYMSMAWIYLQNNGVVTDSCFPYTAGKGVEAACATSCVDGSAFTKYKCAANSIVHPKSVDEIKSEIFNHGPVEAAFTVYEDFFSY